jgi:hypothetical protein
LTRQAVASCGKLVAVALRSSAAMMRRMLASSSVVALVVQRADLRFLVRPEGFEPPDPRIGSSRNNSSPFLCLHR